MSERVSSTRTYLAVWAALALLMLMGVLLAELPIPKATIVLVVLILSSIKAFLVASYYMHLKIDPRLLQFIAIGPLLLILLALGVVFSSVLVHL